MPNHPLPSLQSEEWLTQRLANISESNPRFEASWYGPYNALLSHYFPYQQRFLVKPQLKVRELDPEDGDVSFSSVQAESSFEAEEPSFAADLSMTSMGGLAMRGGSTVIPDFIIAKATEFASYDKALLLVEIKARKPETESVMMTYEYQMNHYMNLIVEQAPEDTKPIGLLVCGTEVTISRLEGSEFTNEGDLVRHDVNSTTIRQLLLSIAEENWD